MGPGSTASLCSQLCTCPGGSASALAGNPQHTENGQLKSFPGAALYLERWGQGQREPRRILKPAGLLPLRVTLIPRLRSEGRAIARATPLLLSLSHLLPWCPLAELDSQSKGWRSGEMPSTKAHRTSQRGKSASGGATEAVQLSGLRVTNAEGISLGSISLLAPGSEVTCHSGTLPHAHIECLRG